MEYSVSQYSITDSHTSQNSILFMKFFGFQLISIKKFQETIFFSIFDHLVFFNYFCFI